MQKILSILSLVTFLSYGSSPSIYANGQCLSDKDDLTAVTDTNLSGIQDFNIELFKRVVPKEATKNFIFSPYSIWNALVLAYFGSSGETERQFQEVLRVTDKVSTLRKWRQLDFMYLMRPETAVNNTFVLSNRAFFDHSVILRYCMEDILHNEVDQLDFMNNATGAADAINQFVSETTRGHIKQLVSPMDVQFAHMVLVNAAFFKGSWASTFNPEKTKMLPFTNSNGKKIDVPMMTQFADFNYGYDDFAEFEVLELPYVGNVISMFIFRPYTSDKISFDKMIFSLTSEIINKAIQSMFTTRMHVFLPKFKMETLVEDELLQALYRMGLRDAFIPRKANFKGFSFNRELSINKGIHKAFIDVNEEGTEAGAATAFIVNKIGGSSVFRCDSPFVMVIRDNETQNLLFMGAYKSPEEETSQSASNPTGNIYRDAGDGTKV